MSDRTITIEEIVAKWNKLIDFNEKFKDSLIALEWDMSGHLIKTGYDATYGSTENSHFRFNDLEELNDWLDKELIVKVRHVCALCEVTSECTNNFVDNNFCRCYEISDKTICKTCMQKIDEDMGINL